MALSIFVPIGYISVLVFSLSIFSRVYRKRKAQALVREHGQPWFPEGHPERDIYQTLMQASASAQAEGGANADTKSPPIPDVVLKAALLNRAMADVRRIIRMRDDKQALTTLLQKGSIGDETMTKFTLAEKELEAEILDVVSEANTFREGWGQMIFPTASEMVAHLKHKDVYYGIQQQRAEEVRKLTEAGLPVPQPKVALPPLITPAGTQITIQAPASMAQAAQQQRQTNGATTISTPTVAKSGTIEDAKDEKHQASSASGDRIAHLELVGPSRLEEYLDLADGKSPSRLLHMGSPTAESLDDDDSDQDGCCDSHVQTLYFRDPTPHASPAVQEHVDGLLAQQQQQQQDRAALDNQRSFSVPASPASPMHPEDPVSPSSNGQKNAKAEPSAQAQGSAAPKKSKKQRSKSKRG